MNTFPWFDQALALRLFQALLHFVWQGFAVALLAVLSGTMLKRARAHVRYGFYVASLGVMVLCLPVTFALLDVPGQAQLDLLIRPSAPAGRPGDGMPGAVAGASAKVPDAHAATEPSSARVDFERLASAGSQLLAWMAPLAPAVTACYFLGVALMTLRLSLALNGGRRLRQSAIPVLDDWLLASFGAEIQRMGVKLAPAVAYCERISVPIVVGIVKPMILLPAALASGLTLDQLQILVVHELAHVRRLDMFVNLFQRLAEAVLFFHPAVWLVSRRISTEREIAADDMVLAAGWPRARYADALVRMAELASALRKTRITRLGSALAVVGASESEFKRRVLRLLAGDDRPALRLTRAGSTLFLAVLVGVALTPLFVQAWARSLNGLPAEPPGQSQKTGEQKVSVKSAPPKASPASAPAVSKPQEPTIVIAEHVLFWENQIVTWDQVVARLRDMRKAGPFRATFYSTNGLSAKKDGWQDYHDRIMGLYREIFEPVGVTFASVSPRGSARFDAIRTPADLRPDPRRLLSGQVVTPGGEPARDAQVIVLPTKGSFAALDVALSGTQMRDPLDEAWSPTDEKGHFDVYPKDDSYLLAVLHPSGFAIQAEPAKDALIQLQPWATIVVTSTGDVADQQADVSIKPAGAGPGGPGFRVYSIKTKGKPLEIKVPAGDVSLSRSLDMGQGTAIGLPVEEFRLKPAETRLFKLEPPSPADRKRAKETFDRLHGARGDDR